MFGSKILLLLIIADVWTAHCYLEPKHQEECRLSSGRPVYAMPLLPERFPFIVRPNLCTRTNPLIVGGSRAEPGEFPHMAALGYQKGNEEIEWLCGGSLITSRFVITAAHCAKTRRGEPKWVQLGSVRLQNSIEHNRKVERTLVHPGYVGPAVYNDIALVKLERKVEISKALRPICLDVPEELIVPGSEVIATGWGRTGFGMASSDALLKVTLRMVEDEKCKSYYSIDKFLPTGISDRQFCAGPHNQYSQDTCQGDSGGPVQVTSKDGQCVQFLVGITSFGKYCGSGTPGVYMKIAPFLPWIKETVWPSDRSTHEEV